MKTTETEVTCDLVIYKNEEGRNLILLIQRKNDPYKGKWALPGGFIETDETVGAGAARELKEETNVEIAEKDLTFIDYFDQPDRDPRGRIISFAFAAEVPSETKHNASDDASEARWFPLDNLPELAFDHKEIIEYTIQLKS